MASAEGVATASAGPQQLPWSPALGAQQPELPPETAILA